MNPRKNKKKMIERTKEHQFFNREKSMKLKELWEKIDPRTEIALTVETNNQEGEVIMIDIFYEGLKGYQNNLDKEKINSYMDYEVKAIEPAIYRNFNIIIADKIEKYKHRDGQEKDKKTEKISKEYLDLTSAELNLINKFCKEKSEKGFQKFISETIEKVYQENKTLIEISKKNKLNEKKENKTKLYKFKPKEKSQK